MRVIRVASVVAGHGEVASVPILLQRIGTELLNDVWLEPLKPIRQPQQRLSANKDDALSKAIGLAYQKLTLGQTTDSEKLILVLIDAEEELPCVAGPRIAQIGANSGCNCRIVSILANLEFETWFVAAAASLGDYLDCENHSRQIPNDSDAVKDGFLIAFGEEGTVKPSISPSSLLRWICPFAEIIPRHLTNYVASSPQSNGRQVPDGVSANTGKS